MKVYLVWDYMEGEVLGVYSTEVKAEEALAEVATEWDLDEFQIDCDMGIESHPLDPEKIPT